jgi:hypothetical protein
MGDYHFKVERIIEKAGQCTIGQLYVDGQRVGYSLELPWKWNQRSKSAIPEGVYSGHLRYDKKDQWRIQLNNVKGRSGIQIHIGNVPKHTKGCILVGTEWDGKSCQVTHSREAYNTLKRLFYGSSTPSMTPNKRILVEIVIGAGAISTW